MRWWFGLVKLALYNLRINKLRSVLTILGMVFGTGAVIATLSSSEGAASHIRAELEKLGTKSIVTRLKEPGISFHREDAELLEKYSDLFLSIFITRELVGVGARAAGELLNTVPLIGVEPSFFVATQILLSTGRTFSIEEFSSSTPVAIIGSQTKTNLFGPHRAVGNYIHLFVGEIVFPVRVIGVMAEKGGDSVKQDAAIFIPNTLAEKLSSESLITSQLVGVLRSEENSIEARHQIETALNRRYASLIDVTDSREAIERTKTIWNSQNLVGLCLAFISLITGGVGIMNIMLLSVAQRKKEIGLRKAVGAADFHIMLQFLLEAVIICFFGGVLGILIGFAFGQQVASLMGNWNAVITLKTIVSALFFSMLTGVIFGILPAMRAAKLDPYEALRG